MIGLTKPVSQVFPNVRLARLELVKGPGAPRDIVLEGAETIVGRSKDADITLDSPLVSRRHIIFRKKDGQVRCEDLGSSSGMFLNGLRANGADLYEGDMVQIADVVMVFHEGH